MSYYMGDYYRGGFFSFLGGLARSVIGLPAAAPKAAPVYGPANPLSADYMNKAGALIRGGKAVLSKHPVLSAAAAAGALAAAGGGAALARRGKKGAVSPAAMMGGRRHRRMHVTNVRALRRALRRTHGFAKLAMRVIRLEHPRKHGKFGGFKRRKRARV